MLVLSWIAWAKPADAGLYNTSEPNEGKLGAQELPLAQRFLVFRDTLFKLRSIGMDAVPFDNDLRRRYLLAEHAAQAPIAKLSAEQKLNLGAVLIRRKKLDAALDILRPVAAQERDNFLVLANLATAYALSRQEQEQRAISTLEEALAHWPSRFNQLPKEKQDYLANIKWHEGAYEFYRESETFLLKLLKLRARETRLKDKKSDDFDTVDALFGDGKAAVKFVGESGKFEPGKIAAVEKAKLPKRAVEIVEQLLVWMPEDIRLYWLLGELINAEGDIAGARMIFNELFGDHKLRTAEVRARHRALNEAKLPAQPDVAVNQTFEPEDKPKDQPTAALPEIRTLLVGFGAGVVVGIFVMWQVREFRRRRALAQARR